MPRFLKVPERHRPALVRIGSMEEDDFSSILNALANTQATLNPRVYASRAASKVIQSATGDVTAIITALVPMFWLLGEYRDVDQLVTDISTALSEDVADFSESVSDIFKPRLASLLELESTLGATAKAASVQNNNERSYCDASIVTDIRPIFYRDADKQPVATTVVCTLKIRFHQGENVEHGEFFVVMDSEDLISLEKVIDRAKRKSQSIDKMLEVTHIPVLKTEQD